MNNRQKRNYYSQKAPLHAEWVGPCTPVVRLFIALLLLVVGSAATNRTYTVKTPVWETTNAIAVIPNHEKKSPPCTLIRYVENGRTNEFHAWAVPVIVITNPPAK